MKKLFLKLSSAILIILLLIVSVSYNLHTNKNNKVCLTDELKIKLGEVLNSEKFSIYKIEENSTEIIICIELFSYDKLIAPESGRIPSEIWNDNPFSEFIFSYAFSPEMSEIAKSIRKKIKVRIFQNLKYIKDNKISCFLYLTDKKEKIKAFDIELLNAVCEVECSPSHNQNYAVFQEVPIHSFKLFSVIDVKEINELQND